MGSDWPQFMHDAQHTGDAYNERLDRPLVLKAQIKLDDAVLSSPAVVGGLVYVIDQIGAAYCVDPHAGRIVWKSSPEGGTAFGSNTSSPCVTVGKVFYGTIAGSLDRPVQLWGPAHGCGAVVVASEGFALSATLEGIYAVDCETGKVIWKSPGFASWACPHPVASNGRIYYCPQVNGTLYCFEPK